MCHVAQELAPSYFDRSCHVSVCGECSCVTTLQGRLIARLREALERSSGMTLSRKDLALSGLCEKCSATEGDSFRCLVTRLRV